MEIARFIFVSIGFLIGVFYFGPKMFPEQEQPVASPPLVRKKIFDEFTLYLNYDNKYVDIEANGIVIEKAFVVTPDLWASNDTLLWYVNENFNYVLND